ncbi:MAG TPA: hypothetical protein VG937_17705 [Polyangiaceae bacterium]|nr:hypothetical protein [Polyangiaceae bacterium]
MSPFFQLMPARLSFRPKLRRFGIAAALAAVIAVCATSASAQTAAPANATAPSPTKDELAEAGYIPGYRQYQSLGLSPYAPGVGTLPGGVTPSFGAPTPRQDWTFTFAGYMSATAQASIHDRRNVSPGQSESVWHIPTRTPDEYASFTSTAAIQGSWVDLKFLYGSQYVTAQVSIDTWNPSQPTTYYQLGSQYFINNAFLSFRVPPLSGVRLLWNVGYFGSTYGNLGRYGGGMYVNPLQGTVQGVGEQLTAEYDLSDKLVATLDHGIVGPRVGTAPQDVAPNGSNGSASSNWVSAFVHHAHLGLVKKGDPTLQLQLHYLTNWAQDDRSQRRLDVPTTEAIDESYFRDGRMTVLGLDARAIHPVWGYLAGGVSYLFGHNAYPLRGLQTYAGEGERLTNAWWGRDTTGTGKLLVGAINYSTSVGRMVTYPDPFPGNHADLQIDAGFHIAKSWTDSEPFQRTRHKYGVNALYTFSPYMAAGVRVDRVVPNSLDSRETFHVLAPRLQFKTDWNSHEAITLHYVKWFYGSRTRGDNNTPLYLLDDQVVALNFNMWW